LSRNCNLAWVERTDEKSGIVVENESNSLSFTSSSCCFLVKSFWTCNLKRVHVVGYMMINYVVSRRRYIEVWIHSQ
jgi:hypothetical protein